MGQATLFDTEGPPEPPEHVQIRMGKANPTVEEQDKPRLAGNRKRIIERLREGPATNAELSKIGGLRFGARIQELRKAGWDIEQSRRDGGVFVYELLGGPE